MKIHHTFYAAQASLSGTDRVAVTIVDNVLGIGDGSIFFPMSSAADDIRALAEKIQTCVHNKITTWHYPRRIINIFIDGEPLLRFHHDIWGGLPVYICEVHKPMAIAVKPVLKED